MAAFRRTFKFLFCQNIFPPSSISATIRTSSTRKYVAITHFMTRSFSTRTFGQGKWRIWKRALGVVGVGLVGGLATVMYSNKEWLPLVQAIEESAVSPRSRFSFIADVVERVSPSVVGIKIEGLNIFTGQALEGLHGSGFIIREDGLILTNAHVVDNVKKFYVKLQDGKTYEGHVQAMDRVSDLATVKINASGLPALKLGTALDLKAGEWVVAIGSPLNLPNTASAGIVSTVVRQATELGEPSRKSHINYIQTDAIINSGNSGGPLINLDGEVVGINTAKVTAGISFAIHIDDAKKFLGRAEKVEKRSSFGSSWFSRSPEPLVEPKRRYMGVTMLTLTPNIITELRTRLDHQFPRVTHGVLLHRIVAASPADVAGLKIGDVITKINGKNIYSADDVYTAVMAGGDLKMTVHRGENISEIIVKPEDSN